MNEKGKIIQFPRLHRGQSIKSILDFTSRFERSFRNFRNWCTAHDLDSEKSLDDADSTRQLVFFYMFLTNLTKLITTLLPNSDLRDKAMKLESEIKEHVKTELLNKAMLEADNVLQAMLSEDVAKIKQGKVADLADLDFLQHVEDDLIELIQDFNSEYDTPNQG